MAANPHSNTFKYAIGLSILWTFSIALIAIWTVKEEQKSTLNLATTEARAYFNKDQAIRLWATQHGRIYVPATKKYSPDPNLTHIQERDISTPSGIALTLINPARIIRELDENFGRLYGVTGKVTSLTPLAKENLPDAWEEQALKRLQQGEKEVFELTKTGGKEYLRLMQPLMINSGCLLCHFDQNFKIDEPGGGIGINLPMQRLRNQEATAITSKLLILAILWALGVASLVVGATFISRQIKIRQQMLRQLQRSEKRKSAIMETALDAIITIDKGDQILEFNPSAEKTFGYSRKDVIGKKMAELIVPKSLRKQHYEGFNRHLKTGQTSIMGTRIETTAMRADGTEFPVELAITRIEYENAPLFTAYIRDITSNRQMAQQLVHQASHDYLTDLLNRHSFEQALQNLLDNIDAQSRHSLMYMDLDRFKLINDSCGHAAGDELLRQLSVLLNKNIGNNDILARLGGDEFGLVLTNHTQENALAFGQSLLEDIQDFKFYWDNKIFSVGMSIGMVSITDSGQNIVDLLRLADAACYRAKEEGRNRIVATNEYDGELLQKQHGEINWITNIESAFEQRRFVLYQQPICITHIENSSPAFAMEILLRMIDPEGNIVTPDHFIPSAERYNLMSVIDRWVVRNTFSWLTDIDNRNKIPQLTTINLSGASVVDPLFLDFILEQFQQSGLVPNTVCLEITETVAITNLSRARRFITELHDAGCKFALDDFGSGMSSYGYLKDLPVDFLKIDGQFVQEMDKDPISLAMVKSINEISQLMGKTTIAEHVANEETMILLKNMGVDYAQGYYLGKPSALNSLSPGSF
jgi:diguanylate cyclase (GGDEF)-like protein/PAS domain S-box-containing protein